MTPGPLAQLRAQVHAALDAHDFEAAFAAINVTTLRAVDLARTRRVMSFGAVELDDLCLLVGHRWLATHQPERELPVPASEPCDLYVASGLYDSGGHSALLGDFVRASSERHAVLAVTNLADQPGGLPQAVQQRIALAPSQVEMCQSPGLTGKFVWLIDVIDRVRPGRIVLFNHHEDCMAIAACQPGSAREIVFVHHSDRVPSVGAFLPGAVHVDVTPFCLHCCREQAGLANRFVPLVAPDEGARASTDRSSRAMLRGLAQEVRDALAALWRRAHDPGVSGLRTAAAGSPHKFTADYEPDYFSIVAAGLSLTRGSHVHIGPLPEEELARVRRALTARNIEPSRFIHVPYVESVWRAMVDYEVDLYIGSFPTRGARTSVEVMGSGTPALWHVTRSATRFHDTHMKYDGAAEWQTQDEMLAILRRADRSWLTRQSRLARRHYERNHHPSLMAACLSADAIASHPVRPAGKGASEPRLVGLDELLSL